MAQRTFSLDGEGSGPTPVAELGVNDPIGGVDSLGSTDFGRDGAGGIGGDGGGDDFTFDPARHVGRDKRNADGSYTKKRGRKPGGSGPTAGRINSKAQASNSASVDTLAQTLLVVHFGLSTLTKTKELALDEDDSKTLATAIANFMAEFDVIVDSKTQATVGLIMAAGMVYGPKVIMINQRLKDEKNAKKKPNVVSITGEALLDASNKGTME